MSDLIQYIKEFFPWMTDEQARLYLVMETPWPIVKNHDSIKAYIRTRIVRNWDAYVKLAESKEYTVTEAPEARIIHPADMALFNIMAVPNFYKND